MNKVIKVLIDNGYKVIVFPEFDEVWVVNVFNPAKEGSLYLEGFRFTDFIKNNPSLESQSTVYILQRLENELENMDVLKTTANTNIKYFCYVR